MTFRARHALGALLLALVALAAPAHAAGPTLHTYFEPNPDEDLALRATTPDGKMPAAIKTPSGVAKAPDPTKNPLDTDQSYGGSKTPSSIDATYRIDRNTSRPQEVGYDDPFIPSITPFKREYAFDKVDDSLELGVADKSLTRIAVGGSVHPGDDQFFADMVVDLAEDAPVRIPTVGPGARVLVAQTNPPTTFTLMMDGAENWFIKASERKRVQLTMELAISRAVFGSPYGNVSWEVLSRRAAPIPASVRPAADRVLASLGVSRSMTPAAAAAALIAHFRGFAPSDNRPTSQGAALYEELALSKKGVCRHRAYAFVITALAIGLPARMARNEAHAWVEIYDGALWHRIDLGGAAEQLDTRVNLDQPQHSPPPDPYQWPDGAESGQDLAQRTRSGANGTEPKNSAADGGLGVDGGMSSNPVATLTPGPGDAGLTSTDDPRPPAKVSVRVERPSVQRGDPLKVSGRIESDGSGCRGVRVDFALRSDSGTSIPIQSLSTGDDGRYAGAIVVPLNLDVGNYELMVSTPGDSEHCGRGHSE